jgi:N-acetylneuraminic acid mutarotase/uncharacterized GH25 family protein
MNSAFVCRNLVATVLAAAAIATQANAHFLWLKGDSADGKPQAVLIFGESAADEAYHLPESLADVEIFCRTSNGERSQLKTEKVENDDRVGVVAPLPSGDLPEVAEATREYGVYGDFLLTYYAKHIHAKSNEEVSAAGPSKDLKLDIVPKATDDGLELTVLWDGKPREDVTVNVKVDGENEDAEAEKFTTDADGKVTLQPEGSGLVAVLANVSDDKQKGELKGKKYTSAAHYSSLTFPWKSTGVKPTKSAKASKSAAKAKKAKKVASNSGIAPLPEAVSSFGAAVADGYLYVYSGHTGTEHAHSAANLSQHFVRAPLDGSKGWEELPMQTPLQGLPIVAYGGKIYRVGGLNARNATTKDEEDLHSTAEFAEFDPATKKWTALAPLPAARSSHNAAVIGDKLYVTGGWTLSGSRDGEWLEDSLVYDFADPSSGWQKLPKQEFQRRALAAAAWQGKLAALGGMDQDAEISRRVDFFDPSTGKWTQGPDLPGTGMSGFGVSAWTLGDNLYVSGFNGRVFQLSSDGEKWEVVGKLIQPRFFHQLVPAAKAEALLVLGGASRDGHLDDVELIDVSADAAKKVRTADESEQASDDSHHGHHGAGDGNPHAHGHAHADES